jgi:hypothetical protein
MNGYAEMVDFYGIEDDYDGFITEFIYDEVKPGDSDYLPEYDYEHSDKYPLNGEYYPLSGLKHRVCVRFDRTNNSPERSKTSGEALAE